MAEVYSRNMMKVAVAKMLQTIGWNSINSTPLEILTDIMVQYVLQIARSTHDYANEFGCSNPSLDHLGLAFRDFHINISDLEEYATYVTFAPPPTPVPKFPVPKENNLNFLKPGSKEVITRQVHVHEHLPPMSQTPEVPDPEPNIAVKAEDAEEVSVTDESASTVFKRPADVSPSETFKKPRLTEEEGRPTREISSVIMTTSGYISPAREGKMPESRTPTLAIEPALLRASTPPPHTSKAPLVAPAAVVVPNYPPESAFPPMVAPPKVKSSKKAERPEKKKSSKELFKNGAVQSDAPVKKPDRPKKPPKEPKIRKPGTPKKHQSEKAPGTPKMNKALAAARMKTEKLNTTITPIPKVDKLSNEPDKKKANIFKKISNVKAEKEKEKEGKAPKSEIRTPGHSPDLVVDEPVPLEAKLNIPLSSDVTIELVNAAPVVEKSEKLFFDDESPPGTPSTPKTPDMMVHATPPMPAKEKRKRKDKTKVKKVIKPSPSSPPEMEMERPKTPEAHVPSMIPPNFPAFPSFPAFPGVGVPGGLSCPPQLINPLIPMNPMNHFFGLNTPGMPAFLNRPGLPPFMPPLPAKQPTPEVKAKVMADSTSADVADSPLEVTKKKKDKKDKIKKKNKKDKLKNKEDKIEKKKLKEGKKEKIKKEKKEKRKDKEKEKERENVNLKLTLKIGGEASPRPDTPDRKLNIKPIIKREESPAVEVKREMSPELAKISALVTGQPKPKLSPVVPTKEEVKDKDKEKDKEEKASPPPVQRAHPGPGRPSGPGRSPGPGRPRIHPIKQKPLKPSKRPAPAKDSDGNEVWICPACGRQDDGSPMIGCDDCDAWYHWVCVGIQVPPDETENWYCRQCIAKKQEVLHTDKKKKRKKKEKKDH